MRKIVITDIRRKAIDSGIICKVNGATVTIDCDFFSVGYEKKLTVREGAMTTNVFCQDSYCITDDKDTPFLLSERLHNGHLVPWEYDTHPSFATIPNSHTIIAYKDSKAVCSIW